MHKVSFDFIQTCIIRVIEFLHISMPTLNPVGDTTGYTSLIVQPLVDLIPTVQPLNKQFVQKTPFTMTGVYQVPSTILPGDWAVKLDLANGMHIIFLRMKSKLCYFC